MCLAGFDNAHGCLVALALALGVPGCAAVGTEAIGSGRAAYNEIITRTGDEQMLGLIVRTRYGESVGLLAVSAVTANVHVSGSIAAELGIGPDSSFAGNLVPFSAGAVYEENPTISYTPVQGEEFVRQLLAPLSVEILVLYARTLPDSELILRLLVERINALRNPLFAGESGERDEFLRVAALIAQLELDGSAYWVLEPGAADPARLVISGYGPAQRDPIRELLDRLGLRSLAVEGQDLVLPVRLAVGTSKEARLDLQTRSVYEVLEIAASTVEVPETHRGVALPQYEQIFAPPNFLRIRSSEERPDGAVVAVQHRDVWFYIDDSDAPSKFAFRTLVSLVGMRLSEASTTSVPTLTIPASR
ncbi:MAG: hypothetical protein ACREI8_09650 [Myxococcota bacterium]